MPKRSSGVGNRKPRGSTPGREGGCKSQTSRHLRVAAYLLVARTPRGPLSRGAETRGSPLPPNSARNVLLPLSSSPSAFGRYGFGARTVSDSGAARSPGICTLAENYRRLVNTPGEPAFLATASPILRQSPRRRRRSRCRPNAATTPPSPATTCRSLTARRSSPRRTCCRHQFLRCASSRTERCRAVYLGPVDPAGVRERSRRRGRRRTATPSARS